MNIITRLFNRKASSREAILNAGLAMVMDFGSNWLKPIDQRLGHRYRHLSATELDDFNTICQDAMKQGHDFIYSTLDHLAESSRTITNSQLRMLFNEYMKCRFDWLNDRNLTHLYRQANYYAWKDGLGKVII